jgi:dihydrodipicolinate synthase/N-acetylneuraminate lyase
MATFKPGLVHTPVTPFRRDQSIDFDAYGKLLEFHLRHGLSARRTSRLVRWAQGK